ncbi:MAG: hypothetical protein ACC656_08530, partial [Candidatus Heimdallarchaeota archaeon]
MRQILITKSPVTVAILSDTGEVHQLHEHLDDTFALNISELLEIEPSLIITDSNIVNTYLNSKNIKNQIDLK